MSSVVIASGSGSGVDSGSPPPLTSPRRTKPRVMYSSGRGGSGNIRRKLPPSPTTSTLVPPKMPHLDRASVISDSSGNFSSSGSSIYSRSSRPPTSPGGGSGSPESFKEFGLASSSGMRASSLLSVPGSLSSLPVKAYLIDDTVILAQGREVEQTPSKRSGRGGAGSYQKVIEKNSEFFDPVRHPRTAALMAEYKETMDSRERALLQQSQIEYSKKVRMGRGGRGNMVKGNALKLPKQARHKKSRSASLDVPRRSQIFASRFGNPDVRALAISTDNLHLTPDHNPHHHPHHHHNIHHNYNHEHDEDEIPQGQPPFRDENAGDVNSKKKRGVLGFGKMFKFKKSSSTSKSKKKRGAENRAPEVESGVAI